MKLLLISPTSSIHTIRWANSLINHVDELVLVSMHDILENLDGSIVLHRLKFKAPLGYVLNFIELKQLIKTYKPDIINTHYLSGYGTLSALSINKKKTPYLLSMWGTDIYDFPEKSLIHKLLIKWVSKKASALASTSYAMQNEFIKKYPNIDLTIYITPFGVDINLFSPRIKERKPNETFEIGIAKTFEYKYGIEYLIDGFKLLQEREKFSNSRLHIIGSGSIESELKNRALNNENIIFYGRVNNSDLPKHLNNWHVCVIPSNRESFGVSAVEASSCAVPVIASNIGGLPEVVINDESGFIVPTQNAQAIYEKLMILFSDEQKRIKMGKRGRERVLIEYDWNKNVQTMMKIYKEMISTKK